VRINGAAFNQGANLNITTGAPGPGGSSLGNPGAAGLQAPTWP